MIQLKQEQKNEKTNKLESKQTTQIEWMNEWMLWRIAEKMEIIWWA